jgi:hypothetical protein
MVMFNYVESYQRTPKLRWLNTGLTGFEAGIPDSYELRHEDLADLLNRYKAMSEIRGR